MEDLGWIDEPMVSHGLFLWASDSQLMWCQKYQQIFAICQALPGSASVKMIFTINAIHGGYVAGMIGFVLFWYGCASLNPKLSWYMRFA